MSETEKPKQNIGVPLFQRIHEAFVNGAVSTKEWESFHETTNHRFLKKVTGSMLSQLGAS